MKLGYCNSLIGQNRPRGASFVGALDGYTANLTVAASAQYRMLSAWTDGLLTGWRSSDSTTLAIGALANGVVDSAAAEAFAPSGTFNLTQLNDQTGNARHWLPPATANAPRLANGGTWDGGMVFTSTTPSVIDIASAAASNYTDGTNVQVVFSYYSAGSAESRVFDFGPDKISAWFEISSAVFWDVPFPAGRVSAATPTGTFGANNVISFERQGTTARVRLNGSIVISGTVSGTISATSIFRFGATIAGSAGWDGKIRTIAIWKDCVNPGARAAAIVF